ncbi:hypothetical protein N440_2664 [Stenotrophomonas sp. CC22-02]|nr:hypothetical protein N440_2664 [Stenotrophomonas sp. CC22-02]
MPASIGGAGIGTGGALHFSGGSGAMSTVIRVAVVLKGLLRIGRLILRTRLGRQGLLRRNLITVFFTVNNPREKFSHPRHSRWHLHGRCAPPATTRKARCTRAGDNTSNACVVQKPLEISTPRRCMHEIGNDRCTSPTAVVGSANASTTAPQRGAKSFHIRTCRRRVETRICAKLRMPVGTAHRPADAAPRVRSEPCVMSPTRSPKQKRPPEGGRVRTRKRRLSGLRFPGLRRMRPGPAVR